jgi:hypothetical protein
MVFDSIPSDLVDKTPTVLSLEEIRVDVDSVSAAIRVIPCDLRVDERLAAAILALRPQLAQHVCKQRGYGCFGDKLVGATLPHLIEHVAIDLLVADGWHSTRHPALKPEERQQRARAGTTTWLDRRQGTMRVRVSYFTDTAEDADRVCAAITRAITLVSNLLAQ